MLKLAYQIGVDLALEEAGLLKVGQGFAQQGIAQSVKRKQWGQPATGPAATPPVKALVQAPTAQAKPPAPPPLSKATGPSMLSKAWGEGKSQLLSPPPTQMGMRRSNIESQRQRLKRF